MTTHKIENYVSKNNRYVLAGIVALTILSSFILTPIADRHNQQQLRVPSYDLFGVVGARR